MEEHLEQEFEDDAWSLNEPSGEDAARARRQTNSRNTVKYKLGRLIGSLKRHGSLTKAKGASATSAHQSVHSDEQLAELAAALLVSEVVRENNELSQSAQVKYEKK